MIIIRSITNNNAFYTKTHKDRKGIRAGTLISQGDNNRKHKKGISREKEKCLQKVMIPGSKVPFINALGRNIKKITAVPHCRSHS